MRTAQSLTCRWATASQLPSLLPTAQNLFLKKFDLSIVNLQCPVSGAQKVIVTHSHRLSLLQIIFSYKLSQNVESSLCYATGPCWLSFLKFIFMSALYVAVCVFIPSSCFIRGLPVPFGNHVFSIPVSLLLFCKSVHLCYCLN